MEIRMATMDDLEAVTYVEAECFPEAEAASREDFAGRLSVFPNHFWLLLEGNEVIGFVNGLVTDEEDLSDEMYEKAGLHDEGGRWQMIFGLDVIPAYRRQGCAGLLLNRAIEDAKAQHRAGVVLTCKDRLVHYYARFGFVDEGISDSSHGGVIWHQMRLRF